MKSFITTFMLCFVLLSIALFFGGWLIFGNPWGILGVAAFFVAAIIESFINMEKRIKALEKRVEELEGSKPEEKIDETENIDG